MNCSDIGVNVSKEQFAEFLNSVKGGQFFHIRGYAAQDDQGKVSHESEVSDYWARWGIKYENYKARDIAFLRAVLAGDKSLTVNVKHGVWVPEEFMTMDKMFSPSGTTNDVFATAVFHRQLTPDSKPAKMVFTGMMDLLDTVRLSNRGSKTKMQVTLSYDLPSTHPLVEAAIGDADLQGTLLHSLMNQTPVSTDYEKQAGSFFSLDRADGKTMWYIRDVAVVNRVVRVSGVHKFKASWPVNAIKDAINNQFLVRSKYRTFILNEGNFVDINIGGQAILVDGLEESVWFALPKDVKAAVAEIAEVGS
jgi:hypothetical protein